MKLRYKLLIFLLLAALAGAGGYLCYLVKNKRLNFNELTLLSSDVRGVDISHYQMDVNMSQLAAQGIEFIYIKATEGSTMIDENFAENWQNAKDSPLRPGAYHFFSFDTPGASQAENYIDTVGDLSGLLLPVVDVEFYADRAENPPSADDVKRELKAFLAALEEKYGVNPVIYASKEVESAYLDADFAAYPRWVRSVYYPAVLEFGSDWLIWQYSDTATLSGYSGGEKYIDLNVLNRNKSLDDLTVPAAEN